MNLLQKYQLIIPFIMSFLSAVLVLAAIKFLPQRLPLFYSLPWGEAQLADKDQLFIIPVVSLAINFINLLIIRQLHSQQVLFKTILIFSIFICSLILLLTIAKIFLVFI